MFNIIKDQLSIPDYIETSALTGKNVDLLFETIARRIYEQKS